MSPSQRRTAAAAAAAVLFAAGLASCDGDEDGVRPPAADVAGAWAQVGGRYLLNPELDAAESGAALVLDIADDSGGSLHVRVLASGLVTCHLVIYGLPATDQMLLTTLGWTNLYSVGRPDDAALVLTDAAGREAIFARLEATPDSMLCSALSIVTRHDLSVDIEERSGLAFDGTYLWFTGSAAHDLIPVDPDDGEIATPRRITIADAPLVQAAQGVDLWRICGFCGYGAPGFGKVFRITPGETIADKVDVLAMGLWMAPLCVAYDPLTGSLWIHGASVREGPWSLIQIDPMAEPDRVLRVVNLGLRLDAMCWAGSELLGVTSDNRVVRIDGTTFRVLRTYDTAGDLTLHGIAVAGSRAFALATPWGSSQAVVLELGL